MRALLIVDMQNDFMPGGALPIPQADKIIPIINELQNKFDLVFASQDWHPEKHCSFRNYPPHCVQKTHGAELADELQWSNIEYIFQKGIDSHIDNFSIFDYEDGNAISYRHMSTAAEFLRSYNVTDLYICGVAAEICVKANALDSKNAGFNTFVFWDAVKFLNNDFEFMSKIKDELHHAGVRPVLSRWYFSI